MILEQARRNVAAYPLLFGRPPARIALWGHGRDYAVRSTSIERRVNATLTRRADWFFGYTNGSASAVAHIGFPRDRVTVVQNSTDTRALREDLAAVTDEQLQAFRADHDLHGATGVFMGGLDDSKRLPFLLDAAALVHRAVPDFRVIIAGNGVQANYVKERARAEPWIRYLGAVSGQNKALALRAADFSVMPGRVGLFAVDSITAGLPIFTTHYEFHAPEFEYLVPDETMTVTTGDESEYAAAIVKTITDASRLSLMQSRCLEDSNRYSIEKMVENFSAGIVRSLGVGKRR